MFRRNAAAGWQQDVPGARWFKADLHLHTIDDHPGGKAKVPEGMDGDPADPELQGAYARHFLQSLVESGVQVAGLTPHSPLAGAGSETSAVWRIVDEWNDGEDDDGTPFREKVYAVFPGFEINVNDGRKGVHLLLLLDPEIGRDHYLSLFSALMDGAAPWERGSLKMTRKNADDVFRTLDGNAFGGTADEQAEFLVLGAHLMDTHGVHGEMSSQVLATFPLERLAGIGLPQGKLPEDFNEKKNPGRFWLPLMRKHRQAFFHGSDAYSLEGIGRRHTWLKLAEPRIAALRQAFVASDSRVRLGHERKGKSLVPVSDPPAVDSTKRPWLRHVTVVGRASFFGRRDEQQSESTTFAFSPDLTCVIGGSMTGKSTLLDGLRVYTEAALPQQDAERNQVQARGDNFQAGSASVDLDCPGSDPTATPRYNWPAQFFTQNELQQLAQESAAVESILAKLDSGEAEGIAARQVQLDAHDRDLKALAKDLNGLDERLAEADQAEERARQAQEALTAFEQAGAEHYHRVARAHQNWKKASGDSRDLVRGMEEAVESLRSFVLPAFDGGLKRVLSKEGEAGLDVEALALQWDEALKMSEAARDAVQTASKAIGRFSEQIGERQTDVRVDVERSMADHGFGSAELRQFQHLSRTAALHANYAKHSEELREAFAKKERVFGDLQEDRAAVVAEQRKAFDRVLEGIASRQGSSIRGRRQDDDDSSSLGVFLKSFKQRGITRWWRDSSHPTPAELLKHLEEDSLDVLGMSQAVQRTFRETITSAQRRRLAALRCRDRYVLELEVADGTYRPLDELSGGQRVSLLLTLLLETKDERPLVIDQPEDELDNRFLFETVLPALKHLKGRRQVIVATHDANIVVNGDADMVIQLEATAEKGRVGCAGVIDDRAVRDAIVQTVDGGREAFRLRRRKYGF